RAVARIDEALLEGRRRLARGEQREIGRLAHAPEGLAEYALRTAADRGFARDAGDRRRIEEEEDEAQIGVRGVDHRGHDIDHGAQPLLNLLDRLLVEPMALREHALERVGA